MSTKSQLLRPPKSLASCVAGCILRDTRSVDLSDEDRLNYFPASPLFTATLILEGDIRLGDTIAPPQDLKKLPPSDKLIFQGPRSEPHTSWNPGPILAITVAFFPDAWQRLGGTLQGDPPNSLRPALELLQNQPLDTAWPAFWDAMGDAWSDSKGSHPSTNWTGSDRIKDWTYNLLTRLSQSETGRGLRSAQRQLRRWSGHNRKSLEFFAKVEDLHRLSLQEPDATPADIAAQAGFSDQAHMGRMLKRATGFSPVKLNQRIATEEAFWCYRLLGDRF